MLESQNNERFEMHIISRILLVIFGLLLIYNYYHTTVPIVIRTTDPKFTLLGPYNTTELEVDDVYDQLIDIKNFTFLINPQPCQNLSTLLLLIIVSSKPSNYDNRKVIRETWGRNTDSTKLVFLFGEIEDWERSIELESSKYGDIVQGNFIDAYRNMTYKHVMGLKWVSHHCPMARYILKTDDDVAVNSHQLRQFLARELSPWGAKGLITCQVLAGAYAQRAKNNKWMVTKEEYPEVYYPTYCAGWVILYSQDVIPKLLAGAQNERYFWIDDVHVTGTIAKRIGIARTPISSLILSRKQLDILTSKGPKSTGQFLFGPPELSTDTISQIWKAIPE